MPAGPCFLPISNSKRRRICWTTCSTTCPRWPTIGSLCTPRFCSWTACFMACRPQLWQLVHAGRCTPVPTPCFSFLTTRRCLRRLPVLWSPRLLRDCPRHCQYRRQGRHRHRHRHRHRPFKRRNTYVSVLAYLCVLSVSVSVSMPVSVRAPLPFWLSQPTQTSLQTQLEFQFRLAVCKARMAMLAHDLDSASTSIAAALEAAAKRAAVSDVPHSSLSYSVRRARCCRWGADTRWGLFCFCDTCVLSFVAFSSACRGPRVAVTAGVCVQ